MMRDKPSAPRLDGGGPDDANFRAMVEGAPDPIFIQVGGRFAYLNPACCRMFAADSPDDLLGTPILDRVRPDYHERAVERIRRLNEDRRSVDEIIEQIFLTVDGREITVETKGEPITYGGEDGALVFVRDVSERLRAAAALQRSRRILELFVEHAPAAIAMFDRDMRYIAVSRRYKTDYGLPDEDLVGRSHYDVFPEMTGRHREIHRRCLAGETMREEESRFPRADGTVDWVRWEIRPWREDGGGVGGIIFFSEVITEQTLAAEKIRESEQKFRDMFDKHAAVKLLIDPETSDIVEANAAAAAYYGWTVEQLRSMSVADINPMAREDLTEAIDQVMDGDNTRFEVQHRLADGTIRDVVVNTSIIEVQGRKLMHSIIHDVTARKKAEREREELREQLVQAQKMETIGTLAGGVAHDFNNMLSVINGYAEMALGRTRPEDPLQADLQAILDAGRRAADITRQLLAFARKQTIKPRVLDLNDSVAGLLNMLGRLIGEDVELAWIPGEGVWPVMLDPTQIDQILANLCVNARNAIEGVGRITIETDNVELDEEYCRHHAGFRPGSYAVLTVSDDGCGMDRETQARIFEPFFTTRGLGEGTGLGLSTVYGIVKQNEGFINVYSEPGKGTTFRIYLRRHEGDAAQAGATVAAAPSEGHGETVLLVEDEPAILSLGRRMLESLGYRVLTAGTPREALAIADEHADGIVLLITDVVMPGMNGRELSRRLQERYPGAGTLFMSGYTPNVVTHRGVLEEGVHFMHKPFSRAELAAHVRAALEDGAD